MQVYAKARFVRTSPRKARLVADAIRGKDTHEALGLLKFTPNFAAKLIEKVLKSAIANAENNHHMDGDRLKVSTIMIDGGPIMKRVRYAPQGRGYRMLKRLSHITVMVEDYEPKAKKKTKEVARTVKGRKAAAKPAADKAAKAVEETAAEKPKRTRAKKTEAVAAATEEVAVVEQVAPETVEEPEAPVVEETPVAESVEVVEQADVEAKADGADEEKSETEGGN